MEVRPVLLDARARPDPVSALVREPAEPIADIDGIHVGSILRRAHHARVVLIGESTHGTSEFYRMRAHLTRVLVERCGFDAVCIEGDWPDAAHVDAWAGGAPPGEGADVAFARFPTWMWRNR